MRLQKGTTVKLFKFSKQDLLGKAASAFGVAVILHFCGAAVNAADAADLFALPLFFVALFFGAWWFQKVYRDHRLAHPTQAPTIRTVHADYRREPEWMSRGSKGLPTNFD